MKKTINLQNNLAASTDNGSQGLIDQRIYREIADALRCGVCILDSTYRILYSNPTASRMLASPTSELVGERFVTRMAYDTELPQDYLDQHLEQQKPFDAAFRHPNGHIIWCAMTLSRLSSSDGRLILAQLEDVTQQKGDNTSLLSVDKHYLRLFAQFIKAGGVIFDQDLRYQDVYGNFYRPGFTPANIEGLLVSEIFPRDIADDLSVLMRQALAGEFTVVEKEFQGRFHRLVFTPQQNAQGPITHGIMLVQNLTEAKFAEVSLRESEQLYRIVFETFFDGLIITVDGVIVDVNPAVERMTGYKQGELVGRLPETIVPPEWLALIRDSIEKQQTHILESALQRKDGGIFPVEVQTTTIPYKGQIARLTAVRDVTERKEAERQIRLLATVVRDSKAFIALSNLDGEVLYINPYGLQLVGLLSEELTYAPSLKVLDFFNQPDQTIQIWQTQIAELGRVTCEDHLKSRDGSLIPVERIMNGVYDDQQRPIAIAIIANDIRERQQLEIERIESHRMQIELEKANELRQHKDFFLSVVSHELRTPLTVIRTSADILHHHYDRLTPEKREINFERILSHIDKLNDQRNDRRYPDDQPERDEPNRVLTPAIPS
jgi:PAS domain S-box-containing protein